MRSRKNNKKYIGTVTFHAAHNYGAMLQAYALLKCLENKSDVEVINYYNYNLYKHHNIIRPLSKNPIKSIKRLIEDIAHFKIKKCRYDSFYQFSKNKYKISSRCSSEAQVKKDSDKYDILITGSDQVWNPDIVGELSDIYTLNFGNDKVKRISYAASVGNEKNVQKYKEEYKKKLSRLDKISVREESAKEELQKILPEKNIEVVLDPTLLLTKNEWEEEIKEIKEAKEKYILAYYVEEDEAFVKITNELSKITGLKVIHFDKRNRGLKNILRSAYTEGPLEFINLIKNAEYVLTTSFHATVFSIIFNKKFWIVPHKKTGSRVTDLLKKFRISNRAVNTVEEFKEKDYNEEIDYEKVNKILEKERKKSLDWLKDAIEK